MKRLLTFPQSFANYFANYSLADAWNCQFNSTSCRSQGKKRLKFFRPSHACSVVQKLGKPLRVFVVT
jgi:hypothetical protein